VSHVTGFNEVELADGQANSLLHGAASRRIQKVASSWFFLSTLNYDARSTTHQNPKILGHYMQKEPHYSSYVIIYTLDETFNLDHIISSTHGP